MILSLNLKEQGYNIYIESGILSRIGDIFDLDRKVLIVTDSGVPKEYSLSVAKQCKTSVIVTIPAGEQSKNINTFQNILSTMLENNFTRKDCVVAVGGGVVGDISGFAASAYMRGVDFYNIPTTLLSQIDSSIGGKTAIDFGGVKNCVGAFYQPKCVAIDPDTLKTLDRRQFSAGLAEAIKMAVTFDADLFSVIENCDDLYADIEEIIIRSLQIKQNVVEKDPKENGLRKVLNFGHTIGHAVESAENGRLLHGECVAIGMVPMCSKSVKERLVPVLERNGLPYDTDIPLNVLKKYIVHDKKCSDGGVAAVFSEKMGTYSIENVTFEKILDSLEK